MINRLIDLSIHNKFIVILFTLALVVWGVFSMKNLSIDAVPDITNNQVQVVTISPSLAPQEVEQFITYPIEMTMANVQGVDNIRSISRYGLSVVTIVFHENIDVLKARQLVSEMLVAASNEIPEEYGTPELMPITTGLGEIYQYTLEVTPGYEENYGLTELRTIHDWIVKRQLSGIPGIVEISGFGGYVKQYEVSVIPKTLNEFDITIEEILEALEDNNQNTGGSYIEEGPYASYIRAEGLLKSIEDIENIVITTRNQVPVLIRDVAKVRFGHPMRYGAMTKDGKGETVGGITLMLKGANANQVIERVKDRIKDINNSLPEGVIIKPYLDRSELVNRVINTISTNLTEAALIVLFVLVILLGNLRAGLITASVIPLSLLFAFSLMNIFGVSASIMSIGAIDFGLIVDGTVIIIEGILFYLHGKSKGSVLSQSEMNKAVAKSSSIVGKSAAFGVAIILIVYFPILTLSGIEGKMFKPMAITISFALIGALILSLTYVPVMASLLISKKIDHKENFADRIVKMISSGVVPMVQFALKRKVTVLLVTLSLFVASLGLFGKLGAVFIPNLEEGDLAMQMTLPPGSSLNESIKLSTQAEAILLEKFPEVKSVVSKIGTAEVPTDPMAIEDADIMIVMKERDDWTTTDNREEMIRLMKQEVEIIPGAEFNFTQPIQLRFNELLTGAKSDVVIKIFGDDLEVLYDKANNAARLIENVQGAADIKVEQIEGLPQAIFTYNRSKLARYGLKTSDLNNVIRTAFAGETAGVIFEGERKFDLVVRLQPEYRSHIEHIKQMFVRTATGNRVPLSELVTITHKEGPMQIARDDTRRRITLGINVRNRDIKSLVYEVQEILGGSLKLPPGYYVTYGGEFENLETATRRLMLVLPVALGLIFILLFFTFNSMSQAMIIYVTIPLSVIGGIVSLWVRGLPFSISAGIGFIALFGVAVLNGIVLINQLNHLKAEGVDDIKERILSSIKTVVRPISLTTLVATLGFIPMAISNQAGAEVQRPLATVVIGGLLVAAVLTFVIVPVLYYYVEMAALKRDSHRVQKPKVKVMTIFLLLFTIPFGSAFGQDTELTLDQALSVAGKNNPDVQTSLLSIKRAENIKKAEFDLGLTDASIEYGEINSYEKDYSFSVSQNFGNLFQMAAKVKYAGINLEQQKINHELTLKQLKQKVSVQYFTWQFQFHKVQLLEQIYNEFADVKRIAKLRYETGSSNRLETMMLENKYSSIQVLLQKEKTQLQNETRHFNLLLNTDSLFIPLKGDVQPRLIGSAIVDSDKIKTHPYLRSMEKELDLAKQSITIERRAYFPEFSIGAFNQQIEGVKGFSGVQAQVSLPLWFVSTSKKTKAAKYEAKIAESGLQRAQRELATELNNLNDKYQNLLKRIEYYRESALPNSSEIQRNASLLYQNGDIGYIEYIQSIEGAFDIQVEYLAAMLDLSNIECTLNYLLK